jgi:hypothetical protein
MSSIIKKIKNIIYPPVFIFEGLEKNSKSPLIFAYVGYDSQYWAQISLCEDFRKYDMSRHFVWDILSFIKKSPFKCDFFIIENQSLNLQSFCKLPGFKIPRRVNMELDISAPIEKLLGSQRSCIRRKIRQNKLSYLMANDKEAFDDFYYNMFVPYIRKRHALTAYLESHQDLLEMFKRGALILIKKEEKVIAGSLVEFVDQEGRCCRFGVREGKWEYVQEGALGAAYYFIIIEMKKKGYAKLNIGDSRPFFSNGVIKHKILLDASLVKEKKRSCLWMGLLRNSIGLKHFLTNNSFIFLNEKKDFYRAIFGEIKEGELSQKCEDAVKSSCGGLDGTFFFVFDKLNNGQDRSFLKGCPFIVKPIEEMIIG